MARVIWTPQEKQARFMERPEYECLYGGAAGGGKSDALLVEALRQVHIPHYAGIIFRRTYPQLTDLIERSKMIYPKCFPKAKYNESKYTWRFPSGSKVDFGHMQYEKDRFNYQGKAYDFVGFDELTHFTRTQYMYLMSRNRPKGPGTRVYIRATANPGGVGHGWVKARFITPAPPMTRIISKYQVETPDGIIELKKGRIFVPATVFDNQKLLDNDPMYLSTLAMLPEAEKNALLYGDWDSFEGQVFTEWRNNSEHYLDQKWTHVITPFQIPKEWRIIRGYDFGYAKPYSVGWYAVDFDGTIYRIVEDYGCKKNEANVGTLLNPEEQAKRIQEIEKQHPLLKGRKVMPGPADPSIFDRSRGESVADIMEKYGVYWEKGDNSRIAGKMQYHYRLAFDKNGRSKFYVFNTCVNFIRTIPQLVYDDVHVEDIDTDQEDHIYDECRYVLMSNPIGPRKNTESANIIHEDDPLDLYQQEANKYNFYRI